MTGGGGWNHTAISNEDNLGKGASTTSFDLSAGGDALDIQTGDLDGGVTCLMAHASVGYNASGTDITAWAYPVSGDLRIAFYNATSGAGVDLTSLADSGDIFVDIVYLTDA